MAAQRRRDLIGRRRRREDEGDDEESVITELADDSQSEASVPSDIDRDAEADDSDLSGTDGAENTKTGPPAPKANGSTRTKKGRQNRTAEAAQSPKGQGKTSFATMADTEAMMNGLKVSEGSAVDEAVDFETMGGEQGRAVTEAQAGVHPPNNQQATPAERRRREHEEYKKKRDADPAFIPNRGAFFMHDHRSASPGQNGFRPFGRGRGRGRGDVGGPFSPSNLRTQAAEPTNAPWAHDLHDTLSQSERRPTPKQQHTPATNISSEDTTQLTIAAPVQAKVPPVRSFSNTIQLGNLQLRVSLPGMKAPINFTAVPRKQHTLLPNHRPPLRRDKPVRVSLPDQAPRYIFPSVERSFIFIPRALRPNQQGFGRGRGRTGFGSYGGISSRRTSVYGGSVYSPSVAPSRRSSLAREVTRDSIVSPGGTFLPRASVVSLDMSRPIVRLPPGSQQHTATGTPVQPGSGSGTPIVNMPPPQAYPLPQKPTFRENWSAPIPMHQPRPQKAVSMAGIESPPSATFPAPQQQEQQPFHHQVPAHVNGQQPPDLSAYYPHMRQLSYPNQTAGGTPLSNIPERAIHAQPFQPYQQAGFQPQTYPAQLTYYYQPATGVQPQYAGGVTPGTVVAPVYMTNGQQGAYVVPTVAAAPMAATAPSAASTAATTQPAMVAHESNGMVYYYDPSQLYAPVEGFATAGYAVPSVGGVMAPSPDGYYYNPHMQPATIYYQPQ